MVFLISSQFISDTQCMIASLATSQNWEKENPAAGGGDARPMAGPPWQPPKVWPVAACLLHKRVPGAETTGAKRQTNGRVV
jgi:hypothetical protein